MSLKSVLLAWLLFLSLVAGAQEGADTETPTAAGQAGVEGVPGETRISRAEPEQPRAEASPAAEEQPAAPTNGAVDAAAWWRDARAFLDTGGPVVMLLLGMSVLALTLMIVKLIQFQRARLWRRQPARQALASWHQGEGDEALTIADASANPTAQALARAIRGVQRGLPEAQVREEVLRYGSDALFQLRRGLCAPWKSAARWRRCWACWARCWA